MPEAKKFKVLDENGAVFAGAKLGQVVVEVGAEVELEVSADQEKSLVAAGWLERKGKK